MNKQHELICSRFGLLSQKKAQDELSLNPEQFKDLILSGEIAKSDIQMLISFTNKKEIRDFIGDFILQSSLIAYKQGRFEQVNSQATKVC